jgi:glycosidase
MNYRFKFLLEFHISRRARLFYQFDKGIYSYNGNVIFADFHAARVFAKKMNDRRDLIAYPEKTIKAGQINAMGLIDEIFHYVVDLYREQKKSGIMKDALYYLIEHFGEEDIDQVLRYFAEEFPPLALYKQEVDLDNYLEGNSIRESGEVVSNRELLLEELILLWLSNENPAFRQFQELFDDQGIRKKSPYLEVISSLIGFFESQPRFGPENQNLIEMLRSPSIEVPNSLNGQLEYIRTRWGYLLGKYLLRLLRSIDLISEEEKAFFGMGGTGISEVYDFTGLGLDWEAFSPDSDWMPNLVLIAKNIYVWLDQLSRFYDKKIERLDQIPDEELNTLAERGFSGLWLIGIWERSKASQKIKQMRGNPEAVASAYSLYKYDIANELGGFEAYSSLQKRAWDFGIRLASDMVPNHMGIDSEWVIQNPDWFVSLDHSPFPSYSFNGPNLSSDERVGIYIEDHYYDNSDAAVVFKRVDFWTGSEKYIYHGNDGTSMPWNDTAQLNYLLPELREAVIQTILQVARLFPIIRFDAAMTLTKRHYQRLWFPPPGSGGDIPSRSEFGLTSNQFNQLFPEEFWRQVVDRVRQEVPDTLLLAEAFWLMEGYFVRTLGMHRVYNSAFMNMLRDEKNQEYRMVIKNTLEFEPEILKRYVNFMNNPDERTAVDQFGKGDKYFGICIMLATMPGLPMFGHGQVEGFTEKYGMEYKRAYWEEQPDSDLIARHEREIFPLLRKRYIFSGVENFLLYDFFTSEGHVNEDVFAYSNQNGDKRALVIYHNKYADTSGWIKTSAAYSVKRSGEGETRVLTRKNISEGLGLSERFDYFTVLKDQITGLEYIRRNRDLFDKGLFVKIAAFESFVFTDIYEVEDNDKKHYAQLESYLNGRGVPDMNEALVEIIMQPVRNNYRELVNPGFIGWLIENVNYNETAISNTFEKALGEVKSKSGNMLTEAGRYLNSSVNTDSIMTEITSEVEIALLIQRFLSIIFDIKAGTETQAYTYLITRLKNDIDIQKQSREIYSIIFTWIFTYHLGEIIYPNDEDTYSASELSRSWIDEWLLGKLIYDNSLAMGLDHDSAAQNLALIKILTSHAEWFLQLESSSGRAHSIVKGWLQNPDINAFIQVNRYREKLWFNKESFEMLIWWLYLIGVLKIFSSELRDTVIKESIKPEKAESLKFRINRCYSFFEKLFEAEKQSDFQIDRLLEALE